MSLTEMSYTMLHTRFFRLFHFNRLQMAIHGERFTTNVKNQTARLHKQNPVLYRSNAKRGLCSCKVPWYAWNLDW